MGIRALGHFGECDLYLILKQADFILIETWPSCYFRRQLEVFLSVCVGDSKMSGP